MLDRLRGRRAKDVALVCSLSVLACLALWAPSHGHHVKPHKHHKRLAHHVIAKAKPTPATSAPKVQTPEVEPCTSANAWWCDAENEPIPPAEPGETTGETPAEEKELAEAENESSVTEEE